MDSFISRRAIERLRNGVFDPIAVQCLTMEEDALMKSFSGGFKSLEKGNCDPLPILASYGQGKSHNLAYLKDKALSEGCAVSTVQVDVREIPFHQQNTVYRSLMENLQLPDGQTFIEAWKEAGARINLTSVPHRFRMILLALLSPNKKIRARGGKLHPKEFSIWLEKAFLGHDLPLSSLKEILQAKDVEGYKKESLLCKGHLPYLQMIGSLGKLVKEMGYKGLVLFFDEMESIAGCRLNHRAKSYEILHELFQGKDFVYPVFAFTDDFFLKVNGESYEGEKVAFAQNYAEAWKDLPLVRLEGFSPDKWRRLQGRLIDLYAQAYQINLSDQSMEIQSRFDPLMDKLKHQETRCKVKALVGQLDVETQQRLLAC